MLIANLLGRLAYADPTLRGLTEGLDPVGPFDLRQGLDRVWELEQVLSPVARYHLSRRDALFGSVAEEGSSPACDSSSKNDPRT